MRVIAGRFRGRRLKTASGQAVRPTSSRVRESFFNQLGDLEGANVLDLYAGTGALGIEALSRGAGRVAFVERSRDALVLLRSNLDALGIGSQTEAVRILPRSVIPEIGRLGRAGRRFDLVLMDPPYGAADLGGALRALAESGVLSPGAQVVVETSRRHPVEVAEGLVVVGERRYGDTVIVRLRPAGRRGDAEI